MKSKSFQQHVSVAATVAAILSGVAMTGYAPATRAQQAPAASDEISEVVVTGSRIVRKDLTSNSPLVTVDSAALEQRAGLNVESYLNQLPSFNPAAAPTILNGPGSNSDVQISAISSVGISAVSLRGFGSNRTLTLIDGRRAVPNNALMTVDVNGIPSSMIKRVEIVSGGQSAVYGADAMGGVANFMLRRDFEGLEVDSQYGYADAGDNQQIRASAIIGSKISDGKGHIVFATEYYQRQAAYLKNRDFFTKAWQDPTVAGNFLGFVFGENGYAPNLTQINANTLGAILGKDPSQVCAFAFTPATRCANPNGPSIRFNPDGSIFDTVGNNAASFKRPVDGLTYNYVNVYDPTATFLFNTAQMPQTIQQIKYNETEQYASSPQTRYSLMGSADFDITDHIKFFSDARFAQSRTKTFLAGTNASLGWETTIPYNAATDSPFNPALNVTDPAVVANILANCTDNFTCNASVANAGFIPHGAANAAHPVPVQLALLLNSRTALPAGHNAQTEGWIAETYPLDSFGRRATVDENQAWQIEAGLRFDIPVKDWTGELYYSRGESQTYNVAQGNNSLARWRAETQAADYGYHSNLQSNATGARPNFGSVAVPCTTGFFDTLFRGDARPSDDCLYAVQAILQTRTENQQDVVELNTQGGLFNLPAGEVRGAVGYQFRRNSSQFNPDILQSTASSLDQVIGVYPTGYLDASTTAHDYYGELLVPILGGFNWLKRWELDLGARQSDYNKTKDTFTWKATTSIDINDSLRFRGGFNRATRAPNLGEMFLNLQQVFGSGGTFGDPCGLLSNSPFGAAGARANPNTTPGAPDTTKLASGQTQAGAVSTYLICRAQMGAAAADNVFYGPTSNAGGSAGSPFGWNNQQGTPDLRSETANTWTAGFVLQSPWENAWLKGLSFTADYYSIKMKDVIEPYSVDYARFLCYGAVQVSDAAAAAAQAATEACQNVPRDTSSGVALTNLLKFANQATVNTAGVDFALNWFGNLGDLGLQSVPGGIGLNISGTYLDKYITKLSPASFDVPIDWKGSLGPNVPGFQGGAYDYRLLTSLSYTLPSLSFSLRWRFYPTVDTIQQAQERAIVKNNLKVQGGAPGTVLSYTPTTALSAASYSVFDFSFNWNVGSMYSIRGGVDNLFDRDPVITGATAGYPADVWFSKGLASVCAGRDTGCRPPTAWGAFGANLASSGQGQTNGGYYDTLGRQYYLGIKATF
jgi:outer membrane receptor protein involved in Fe transport